jgi:hypothetical protein
MDKEKLTDEQVTLSKDLESFSNGIEMRKDIYEKASREKTPEAYTDVIRLALMDKDYDVAIYSAVRLDLSLTKNKKRPTLLYISIMIEKYHFNNITKNILPNLTKVWEQLENGKHINFGVEQKIKISQLIDAYIYFQNFQEYQKQTLFEVKNRFDINVELSFPSLATIFDDYFKFKNFVKDLGQQGMSDYMKESTAFAQKKVTDNSFFIWGTPMDYMVENLNKFEKHIHKMTSIGTINIPTYIFSKIITLAEEEKNSILTYFCFENLFELVTKDSTDINKWGAYRDLYPLFQLTHNLPTEDNYNDLDSYQDFKTWKAGKVELILGHKKKAGEKQLQKFFNFT